MRTMTIKAALGCTTVAIVCTALVACGSNEKKAKTTTPTAVTTAAPAAEDTKAEATSEEATGRLRNAILELRRVHFAFDTATLTEPSRAILRNTAEALTEHPDVHLYVQGHADTLGTSEYNIALGNRRAEAVRDYLMALGISGDRLHTVSYGEEKPITTGGTAAERAVNRRVDFKLMRGDVEIVVKEGPLVGDEGEPIASPTP